MRTDTVGMDSRTLPAIPDLKVVAATIRLAAQAEAERDAQRPAEWPTYRGDLDTPSRPTPAREELLAYLQGLPEETVAALYSVYRTGDLHRPEPAEAAERYRTSFSLAMRPVHRLHGAHDLAAKGPLADGLRRGLEHLGLPLEASRAGTASDNVTQTS